MDKSPYRSESAPEMGRQIIGIIVDRQNRSGRGLNREQLRQVLAGEALQIIRDRPGMRLVDFKPGMSEFREGGGANPVDHESRVGTTTASDNPPAKTVTILRLAVGNFDHGATCGVHDQTQRGRVKMVEDDTVQTMILKDRKTYFHDNPPLLCAYAQ
jgi:hypothetical protein